MKGKREAEGRSLKPRAKRSLGQNFLVDKTIVERIVSAFDPGPDDVALEIGPGHGALTSILVDRVRKLYALEFDRTLVPILRERFSGKTNFEVIEDDALEFDFTELATAEGRIRLIANLPYNISTAILQRLFEYPGLFSDCVLMFQREVADRIMAPPGTKDRGYLSVMTELYFDAELLFDVPPGAFRPVPKVWSSVIKLTPKNEHDAPQNFSRIVGAGFSQKRKTIGNNLKVLFPDYRHALEQAGIDPQLRAEALSLDEWLRLSEAISSIEH
jgi:16S rRNA (adenine1518-N6/adenine1519-N6)-dimethyltransferase